MQDGRLTALDRAERVAQQTANVGDNPTDASAKKGRPGQGAALARRLGLNERAVQRSILIAGLAPEAKQAARERGLADNQAALLRATRSPAEEQASVINKIADSKCRDLVESIGDPLTRTITVIASSAMMASMVAVRPIPAAQAALLADRLADAIDVLQGLRDRVLHASRPAA